MNRTLILLAIAAAVVGLIAGGLILLQPRTATTPGVATTTFPGSGTNGVDVSNTTQVHLLDESTATIPDFSKTDTRPNANDTNGYEVAGADVADYQILYYPRDSYFLISLQAEPLGETRKAAEADLRARLRLPDAELCKLNLEVRTSYDVNPAYAGDHLGLSFCPGAVTLP